MRMESEKKKDKDERNFEAKWTLMDDDGWMIPKTNWTSWVGGSSLEFTNRRGGKGLGDRRKIMKNKQTEGRDEERRNGGKKIEKHKIQWVEIPKKQLTEENQRRISNQLTNFWVNFPYFTPFYLGHRKRVKRQDIKTKSERKRWFKWEFCEN